MPEFSGTAGGGAKAEFVAGKTKNILFIMCDQLRWDYLSCYGHPRLHTPHLDALAAHQRSAPADLSACAAF